MHGKSLSDLVAWRPQEHPGVDNTFLSHSSSSLTARYGSQSTLEKHHSFIACCMVLDMDLDLLRTLDPPRRTEFWDLVSGMILATDMVRHAEYLARLNELVTADRNALPEQPFTAVAAVQTPKQFTMQVLVKCADISNVIRPFAVAKKWAMRISDEFFLQGDVERIYGIPLTPMHNRRTQPRVMLQKCFIDVVVGPFYRAVQRMLPGLAAAFHQLDINRALWDEYDDVKLRAECGDMQYSVRLPAYGQNAPEEPAPVA
jgi:hypothetical protein